MKIPRWILEQHCETSRQFASRKRKELREVLRALDTFRIGCAYVPKYEAMERVEEGLEAMKEAMEVKHWR
jgi:hypothetical protein